MVDVPFKGKINGCCCPHTHGHGCLSIIVDNSDIKQHKNLQLEVVVSASCQEVDDGEESVGGGECQRMESMTKLPGPAIFSNKI